MEPNAFSATKQSPKNNTKQPPKNNPTPNISSSHDVDVRTAHNNDVWTCSIKNKVPSIDITILKVYIVGIDETYNVIYKRVDDEEIREKDKWKNVINKHLEDIKEKDEWKDSENEDILTAINGETWRYKDGLSSKRVKISTFCIVGTINVKEVHTIAVSDISLYDWKKQREKLNFKDKFYGPVQNIHPERLIKEQEKKKYEKELVNARETHKERLKRVGNPEKKTNITQKVKERKEEEEKAAMTRINREAKEQEKRREEKRREEKLSEQKLDRLNEKLEKIQNRVQKQYQIQPSQPSQPSQAEQQQQLRKKAQEAEAAKQTGGKHTRKKPRKKTYDTK